MAKLTIKNMTKSPWFFVVAILLVVMIGKMSTGNGFLGAAVLPPSGADVRITSSTDLSGHVLSPGGTVPVTVTLKNFGTTSVDFNVEHRLLAASLYPKYFATIIPTINAVSGQTDSVITQKVTALAPGASVTLNFNAPVPTTTSTIAGKSNVDTSYIQIVGAYQQSGGYISKDAYVVHSGVLVSTSNPGTVITQQCVTTQDCNGWLSNSVTCQANVCTQTPVPPAGASFDFGAFYNDNTALVWAAVIALIILIFSVAIGPTQPNLYQGRYNNDR